MPFPLHQTCEKGRRLPQRLGPLPLINFRETKFNPSQLNRLGKFVPRGALPGNRRPCCRVQRPMRIATFNVNGVNGRLPVLLEWLAETRPDVACLQELKAPDERFPEAAIEKAGYGAIWHGQKSWNGVAILARGCEPVETRRGLPGDPDDMHSRYIEAAVDGVLIGCLYLPNGNPGRAPSSTTSSPGWSGSMARAAELVGLDCPVVLAGDYNIIPTDADVYKPERWVDDALFQPEPRAAISPGCSKQGWTDAHPPAPPGRADLHLLGLLAQRLRPRRRHPHRPSAAQPGRRRSGSRRPASTATSAAGRRPATTRRSGSSSNDARSRRWRRCSPRSCRTATAGNMSPSGTASAASPSATAATSSSGPSRASRSPAISPKSSPCSAG